MKKYYLYILTNKNKTVLYVGVTNNLFRRLNEHAENKSTFTKKYNCKYLIYYEFHSSIAKAIEREKQIKSWKRIKKEELVRTINPDFLFLNDLFIP